MANSKVRRTQAVVPFGVGALVEFPEESLMAASLEYWNDKPECELFDFRLQQRLGVRKFRQPPPPPRKGVVGSYLPFVRFPQWHFCPQCHQMNEVPLSERYRPKCTNSKLTSVQKPGREPCASRSWSRQLVPVPLILACQDGHISDFPWVQWAHWSKGPLSEAQPCDQPRLVLKHRGQAGLAGTVVRCDTCDTQRSLRGTGDMSMWVDTPCPGTRPWMGPDESEVCASPDSVQAIHRAASNVYFANTVSSILIPPHTRRANKVLEQNWELMSSDGEKPQPGMLKLLAAQHRLEVGQLEQALNERLNPPAPASSEESYRREEYLAITGSGELEHEDLVLRSLDLTDFSPLVQEHFERVTLVEKLAETRTLIGFSRIVPVPNHQLISDRKIGRHLKGKKPYWLPAARVYGEGLFVEFRRERVESWMQRPEVVDRVRTLVADAQPRFKGGLAEPSPLLILMHTFAHLLMRQLSFVCGYSNASVRERIYCSTDPSAFMCGLLIYTAAGDAEGTLGGLVGQGEPGRFDAMLEGSLEFAGWCSSDPICSELGRQGLHSLNLAACHACALAPETSCELGNRLLDRTLVVGKAAEPSIGYFNN